MISSAMQQLKLTCQKRSIGTSVHHSLFKGWPWIDLGHFNQNLHVSFWVHEIKNNQWTWSWSHDQDDRRAIYGKKSYKKAMYRNRGTGAIKSQIPLKVFKKSSFPEQMDWFPRNLVCSIGDSFVQIMTLCWPWFNLRMIKFCNLVFFFL